VFNRVILNILVFYLCVSVDRWSGAITLGHWCDLDRLGVDVELLQCWLSSPT
jgi:hypothetical protein